MKKIVSFLFSMLFSVLLLMIFAITIAYATFIENDYGTVTAQALIYHAWWFELLLLIGAINLAGSVVRYKLVTRKKWAILLFHLAFIVIIIGAGITRYFGFEGSMHIREGEESNLIYTQNPYLQIFTQEKNQQFSYDEPFSLSNFSANKLHVEYTSQDKGKITIDYMAEIK